MVFFSNISGINHFGRRWLNSYVVLLLWVICLPSCGRYNEWRREEGAVWNTLYHITYDSPRDMTDSIQAIFREIEMSLSPFNELSVVSRINRGEDVEADADFREVFTLSKEVNAGTEGLFDPTVSPVINLWKFGYTGKVDSQAEWAPTAEEIDSAMTYVGIGRCSLRSDNRLAGSAGGVSFNFSAITKGYACDRIAAMLKRNGATGAMVEIGGEITLFGRNPQGEEWRIQIDTPEVETNQPRHERLDVVQVTDCGIATSGNYRNYHQSSEGRVGHIISPLTGRPVMGEILSVTVIAPTCAEADAYATAAMACGSVVAAMQMLRSNHLKGIIVSATPSGSFLIHRL